MHLFRTNTCSKLIKDKFYLIKGLNNKLSFFSGAFCTMLSVWGFEPSLINNHLIIKRKILQGQNEKKENQFLFILNEIRVRPFWNNCFLSVNFIGLDINTKVPNLEFSSTKKKFPFSKLIFAWSLETEMSVNLISACSLLPYFFLVFIKFVKTNTNDKEVLSVKST